MKQISESTYSLLQGFNKGLPKEKQLQGIYPIVARAETKAPFVVYQVEERPRFSKEASYSYGITFRLVGGSYDHLLELQEALNLYIETRYPWRYTGTITGVYTDTLVDYTLEMTYEYEY